MTTSPPPTYRLAFCLFKYFAHGGLQRDMGRIAEACQQRGHRIDIFTTRWEGPPLPGQTIIKVPVTALTNHGQVQQFSEALPALVAAYDAVIGFNKMPGLDIYYAADGCYQAKALQDRGWWYRHLPRYRLYQAFEQAVFDRTSPTHVLLLSRIQEALYRKIYQTPISRLHFLPPNVARDRMAPPDAAEQRQAFRQTQGLTDQDRILLQLGSGYVTKGLDRSIHMLAALPPDLRQRTQLHVVGQDKKVGFERLARSLGVREQVIFWGAQNNVLQFLLGTDLLVHPAYHENTGTVLLEALVAGLPAVASAACGFSHYLEDSGSGWVIPAPFAQQTFTKIVTEALTQADLKQRQQQALDFAQTHDLYGMVDTAIGTIETLVAQKLARGNS